MLSNLPFDKLIRLISRSLSPRGTFFQAMEYASHLLTKQAPVPGDESSSTFQRQGGDPQGTSRIYLYHVVAQTNGCLGLIAQEHLVLKPDRWHRTRAVTLRNCIYSLNWHKTMRKTAQSYAPTQAPLGLSNLGLDSTKKRLWERVLHRGAFCPPRWACEHGASAALPRAGPTAQPAERTPRRPAAKGAPGGTARNLRKTTNPEQLVKGVAIKRQAMILNTEVIW